MNLKLVKVLQVKPCALRDLSFNNQFLVIEEVFCFHRGHFPEFDVVKMPAADNCRGQLKAASVRQTALCAPDCFLLIALLTFDLHELACTILPH